MVEESDADHIRREREERRALERLRMEGERRERQLALARLRLIEQSGPVHLPVETEGAPPTIVLLPSPPSLAERSATHEVTAEPAVPEPGPSRAIGGSVRPPSIAEFLKINPTERFDLQGLNTVPFSELIGEADGDSSLLATIARQAETLMVRVKQEADDPLNAGAFLRDQVLRWYRESAGNTEWTKEMPIRWGGLFAESRVTGGRLEPWLNLRLWSVRQWAVRAGPLRHKLKRGLTRDRLTESSIERTASQQIHAEVAQAILDDLASHARDPEVPLPLIRLSELAVRREVQTINDALALLFNAPETGPFVVLHPNRYPDCEELMIRPPAHGASGTALAFSLGPARPPRKSAVRDRGAEGSSASPSEDEEPAGAEGESDLDAETIWQADVVAPKTWRRVVDDARRARRRLESPPKEFRALPAFVAFRDLLLEDADFRKAFLAARWRGRPTGIPLLASLLQKGTIAPDVSTDHEYLEAELGELVHGDPHWNPTDGRWKIPGWTITREGSHAEGFRFRADRSD